MSIRTITRHGPLPSRFAAAFGVLSLITVKAVAEAPEAALDEAKCGLLQTTALSSSPISGVALSKTAWHAAGLVLKQRRGQETAPLPAHCEVDGFFGEREGTVGGPYRISFKMRLPAQWNGRYLFQGGGGSNGDVGDALGFNGPGNPTGLERGYAVISQDSGHDNNRNNDPSHGGQMVFGHDPEARANYGHASLKPVYDIGRHIVQAAYGKDPNYKLFWGCSKGGQEGMAFAQRYPDSFDGIVAMAPGMSLPRAALAQAWDTQQLAEILRSEGKPVTLDTLRTVFTPPQMMLVSGAVLKACDADDGVVDGMVGAIGQCTTDRVMPELKAVECAEGQDGQCLSEVQVTALGNIMDGVRDSEGNGLYAPFAWDAGMASPGWWVWKFGLEKGPPALNVVLGGGALATIFTTPPTALATSPMDILDWQTSFDFDTDSPKIYATGGAFKTSAWQDVGMRSTDLSAYRAHGGKLIVPHGSADPVFSMLDTVAWWTSVDETIGGTASEFARVFPVPGMNHCGGGLATDMFDSLTALESWVIDGKAPDTIAASAGPATPWPGRERPLCPYPEIAKPDEAAKGGFSCQSSLVK